ncbi:hypothetical protein TIFTF001_013757 [Ficus carica]|uniref:Uncharacterized protein n=1 Tax=Ficus carica TaxID=3494 RepID=A0AA88AQC5_FICCA|nr:hypothetical protein TIFTF001_013757 [Ficus carica]
MASKIGVPFQDQNFNVQYSGASAGGKMNAIKSQKKGGLGGRKPLGEISNSANIAPTMASKKQNSFGFIREVTREESNRKSIAKTSDKVPSRSRKALSDISNSGKAHLHETSKNKPNLKLSAVEEEHLFPSSIAEEQFLHDHRECIKAKNKPMDVEQFLLTMGLTNVSLKQVYSPPRMYSKMKPENRLPTLELEEITEHLIEDEYLWKQKMNSPTCSPKSPIHSSALWKDCDSINFKLMDSP